MYPAFEVLLEAALDAAIAQGDLVVADRPACRLEPPEHPVFGDATSRVALGIARRMGRPAPDVARALVRHVDDPRGWLEHVEAAGPGFVNVRASLAYWRAALAGVLSDTPGAVPSRGRAIVLRVPCDDPATDARTALVAAGLGRLLAAAGHDVASLDAPAEALAAEPRPDAVERVLAVHAASEGTALRRAKGAFASTGGRAGRVTGVAVGALVVRRRGRRLPDADAVATLATPAARFALAAAPHAALAALDVERLATDRIDNPWVPVHYALVRIARLGAPASDDLDALGEADRECLRDVGSWADVVELAARRGELDAAVAHARGLAATFHRHWNRGAFARAEPAAARARRALAGGVGRVLRAALAAVDAEGM